MRFWKHLCMTICLICAVTVGAAAVDLDVADEGDEAAVVTQASVVKEDNTLNILAIGNSFTNDTMRYVSQIASSAGYDVTVGVLWKGSLSLANHVSYIQSDSPQYQYDLYTPDSGGEKITQDGVSASTVFQDREWDLVFLQQSSHLSGIPSSFYDAEGNSYLSALTGMIRSQCSNPELSFTWLMGWAYAQDYEYAYYAVYNNDQMTMYRAIADTTQNTVWASGEFETVIPVGTAVQNVRTSYVGDNLNRDGRHLTYSLGRYTAGMTVAAAIGIDVNEVTYHPQGSPNVSHLHLPMLRKAAKAAVTDPFSVTQSSYTSTPSCPAPTLTECLCLDSGIELQWSAAENASVYYVYRRLSGTDTWEKLEEIASQTGKTNYQYTDQTAEEGVEYEYRVRSHFDSNLPNPGSKIGYSCLLKAPELLTCQAGRESVAVQWSAYALATQYQVRYATSKSFGSYQTKTVSAAELGTTVENLLAEKTYYVQVCAQKKGTSRLYSSAWSNTMKGETSAWLQQPRSVQCVAGKEAVQVLWDTSGMNGNCEIRYAANPEMEQSKKVTIGQNTQVRTLSGLLADETYYVQLRRRSVQGSEVYHSQWSNVCVCTTEKWLNPLDSVLYTAQDKAILVQWSGSSSATSYQIRYATRADMGNAVTVTVSSKVQKKTLTGLKAGKTYYVQMRVRQNASNGMHYSEWSTVRGCTVSRELKRTRGVTCKAGSKQIRVSWNAVSGANRYQIRYSTKKSMSGAKTVTIKDASELSRVLKSLKAKKTYYVQVRARSVSGGVIYNGVWSAVKRCTTK
ncbi:MAG: DUF4886 domain-containing protein [Butyricicoccus sp.]